MPAWHCLHFYGVGGTTELLLVQVIVVLYMYVSHMWYSISEWLIWRLITNISKGQPLDHMVSLLVSGSSLTVSYVYSYIWYLPIWRSQSIAIPVGKQRLLQLHCSTHDAATTSGHACIWPFALVCFSGFPAVRSSLCWWSTTATARPHSVLLNRSMWIRSSLLVEPARHRADGWVSKLRFICRLSVTKPKMIHMFHIWNDKPSCKMQTLSTH